MLTGSHCKHSDLVLDCLEHVRLPSLQPALALCLPSAQLGTLQLCGPDADLRSRPGVPAACTIDGGSRSSVASRAGANAISPSLLDPHLIRRATVVRPRVKGREP